MPFVKKANIVKAFKNIKQQPETRSSKNLTTCNKIGYTILLLCYESSYKSNVSKQKHNGSFHVKSTKKKSFVHPPSQILMKFGEQTPLRVVRKALKCFCNISSFLSFMALLNFPKSVFPEFREMLSVHYLYLHFNFLLFNYCTYTFDFLSRASQEYED